MTYDLLPSSSYFSYADQFTQSNNQMITTPVVTISPSTLPEWSAAYGSAISWAQGLYDFVTDSKNTRIMPTKDDLIDPQIGNSTLMTQAQAEHTLLDAWTPPNGVHLYTIAGWGNETLAKIAYSKIPKQVCAQYPADSTCAYKKIVMSTTTEPYKVIDGDGTVVAPSALWADGSANVRYWVNLERYNRPLPQTTILSKLRTGHAEIFTVSEFRTLLTRIVTASTTTSALQYISTTTPQYTGDMDRLHFILHSPLTLGFEDSNGHYTGATATSTEFNIPGVDYQRFGEVQWLSVPKSLAGTVVMHGTGTGSFALDVEEQDGNTVVATTTFAAIPSATSTVATLAISPTIDPTASSTLVVNYDGNVTSYHAKQGALVLPDFTPPEAVIGFSTTTQQIEIAGVDDTSTTTVIRTATSTTITDASGNWLTLGLGKKPERRHDDIREKLPRANEYAEQEDQNPSSLRFDSDLPNRHVAAQKEVDVARRPESRRSNAHAESGSAALTIHSLSYSTGTTTDVTATLRYSWRMSRAGEYTAFISTVATSSGRMIAVYVPHLDKTYVVSANRRDDDADLSTHAEELIKRRHIKTYNGLYIPLIDTRGGKIVVVNSLN
jgi:hypothetical protein